MIAKARYNNIRQPKFKEGPEYKEGSVIFVLFGENKAVTKECPKLISFFNNEKNSKIINNFLKQCFDVQNVMSIYLNDKPVSMSSFFNMVALSADDDFLDSININYCLDINNNLKELKNPDDSEFLKSLVKQQIKENKLKPIGQANIKSLNVEYFEFVKFDAETDIDSIYKLMGNFADDVLEIYDPDGTYEDGIFARQIRITNKTNTTSIFLDVGINNFEINELSQDLNELKIEIRNLYKKTYSNSNLYDLINTGEDGQSVTEQTKTITIFASEWLTNIIQLKDTTRPNRVVDLSAKFISKKECILTWNSDDYYSLDKFEISEVASGANSDEEIYNVNKEYKFLKISQDEDDKIIYYKIFAIDKSGNKSEPTYIGLDFKNKKTFILGDLVAENKITNSIISDFKNIELSLNALSEKPFKELEIYIKDIMTYGSEAVLQLDVIFPKFNLNVNPKLRPEILSQDEKLLNETSTLSSKYYKINERDINNIGKGLIDSAGKFYGNNFKFIDM